MWELWCIWRCSPTATLHSKVTTLKLHCRFYDPFKILARKGPAVCKLLLPDACQIHPVFHVSQLKRQIGDKVIPTKDLPLADSEGNIKMAPEVILKRSVVPRDNELVVQWLIKWINLPPEAATWEDASFIYMIFPEFNPWGQGSQREGYCQVLKIKYDPWTLYC